MTEHVSEVLYEVGQELIKAQKKFAKFNSSHEGYAVIKEEIDELWDNIKSNSNTELLREEAIQVAAMGVRFIIDVCDKEIKYGGK